MLGGAAVVGGQLAFAIAAGEARRVDEEEVRLGALRGGPGFQLIALALQVGDFRSVQFGRVADPDVHVALLGLRDGAQAAHQEQAVDRLLRLAGERVAGALAVGERARQALRFGENLVVRLETREARRRGTGNVAGEQRVVDVEQQWHQPQHQLLARREHLHGALQAAVVDAQVARAKLLENLAIDAVVDVGANFVAARHGGSASWDGA